MWEGVGFVCREEGGEGRKGERAARQREGEDERESDTWLPGWASRCNTHTHTHRAAGRPFGASAQGGASVAWHRARPAAAQQQLELGRARSWVGNAADDGAETTFVGEPS